MIPLHNACSETNPTGLYQNTEGLRTQSLNKKNINIKNCDPSPNRMARVTSLCAKHVLSIIAFIFTPTAHV